eukprot:1186835-Prorocentrum_minimum.AAC.3
MLRTCSIVHRRVHEQDTVYGTQYSGQHQVSTPMGLAHLAAWKAVTFFPFCSTAIRISCARKFWSSSAGVGPSWSTALRRKGCGARPPPGGPPWPNFVRSFKWPAPPASRDSSAHCSPPGVGGPRAIADAGRAAPDPNGCACD